MLHEVVPGEESVLRLLDILSVLCHSENRS